MNFYKREDIHSLIRITFNCDNISGIYFTNASTEIKIKIIA